MEEPPLPLWLRRARFIPISVAPAGLVRPSLGATAGLVRPSLGATATPAVVTVGRKQHVATTRPDSRGGGGGASHGSGEPDTLQ